jgi:hypothetical protein
MMQPGTASATLPPLRVVDTSPALLLRLTGMNSVANHSCV